MKRHKYKIFQKRKDCLKHRSDWCNGWMITKRRWRLPENDGYYLLLFDYFNTLEMELKMQYGLTVECYYKDPAYEVVFCCDIPNTKKYSKDNYLDSISRFTFTYNNVKHHYHLSSFLIRNNNNRTLKLLYEPFVELKMHRRSEIEDTR